MNTKETSDKFAILNRYNIGQLKEHIGRLENHIILTTEEFDNLCQICAEYRFIVSFREKEPSDLERKAELWDRMMLKMERELGKIDRVGGNSSWMKMAKNLSNADQSIAFSCDGHWGATVEEAVTKALLPTQTGDLK